MADKRKRIYYTKAQIEEGLVTNGGEWMFTNGTEYIGQYHKYITGEVFSESTFIEGKSKILIPYIDIEKINQQTDFGIDLAKNFEYDSIKNVDVPKSVTPNPSLHIVSNKDITNGYMTRYFAYKANDGRILELSKDEYDKIGTDNGLDEILWKRFTIRWKVIGPERDVLDVNGNIVESGIIDTNRRTVTSQSTQYPTLMNYIVNFREYAVS